MKNLKKYVLLSSLTLSSMSMLVGPNAVAEENVDHLSISTWQQRPFEEIKKMVDQVVAGAERNYTIQWGDTLSTISEVTGISVRDLAQINQISNPDFILAGATLTFNPITKEVSYQEEAGKVEEVYALHDPVEIKPEVQEDKQESQASSEENTLLLAPAQDFAINKDEITNPVEVIIEEPTSTTLTSVDTSDLEAVAPMTIIESTIEEATSNIPELLYSEEATVEPVETTLEEVTDTSFTTDPHDVELTTETTTTTVEALDSSKVFSDPHTAFAQIVKDKGVSAEEAEMWSSIINNESGWNQYIANPSSGAYGLPQALPGSKMASHGADWETNPYTQLAWMYDYMVGNYGSISGAWSFWQANRWY